MSIEPTHAGTPEDYRLLVHRGRAGLVGDASTGRRGTDGRHEGDAHLLSWEDDVMPRQAAVKMSSTEPYLEFLVAAISSLRLHNETIQVSAFVQDGLSELCRLAGMLNIDVIRVRDQVDGRDVSKFDNLSLSRLLKISAVKSMSSGIGIYLDADVIVQTDIEMLAEYFVERSAQCDLLMLPSSQDHSCGTWHIPYLVDPEISDQAASTLIEDTFGLNVGPDELREARFWNSGVIVGRTVALRKLATRWLTLYLRMIDSPLHAHFTPTDELSLWLALRSLGMVNRTGQLDFLWNFVPSTLFGGEVSAYEHLSGHFAKRALIVHFAGNKHDEWAAQMRLDVLKRVGYLPES